LNLEIWKSGIKRRHAKDFPIADDAKVFLSSMETFLSS